MIIHRQCPKGMKMIGQEHPSIGDIDIHELAWDKEGELWVVNTAIEASVSHTQLPQLD